MALTFRYNADTSVPVEVEGITPDRLRNKSLAEIERLEILLGNRKVPLAELFSVSGNLSDGRIDYQGDLSGVHYIGYGMTGGEIRVQGNAGRHLGAEMTGGTIRVDGNAGDWAGAEMHGGFIEIQGDAGDLVGAAYRGGKRGMTDGTILIGGNAGNEICAAMRRGMLAVRGSCGDAIGFNMIAGSILVFGDCGVRSGAGMSPGDDRAVRKDSPQAAANVSPGRTVSSALSPTDLPRIGQAGFSGRSGAARWRSPTLSWGPPGPE